MADTLIHGGASLAEDCKRIEAVLRLLGPGQKLAVDANGRFDLKTAVEYAKALSQYDLFWYEEAGDPLDYALQARTGPALRRIDGRWREPVLDARRTQPHPLRRDAARSRLVAVRLCAELRPRRVSAHTRNAEGNGWSPSRCVPHGGHQMSLAIAAGLGLGGNESYPDLFQPYGGFPDGVRVDNGYVTLPELPGIGFEGKADLYAEMKALAG